MTNAELFKQTFGRYATDVWSLPENEFLEWLNTDVRPKTGRWIDDKCSVCGKGTEDLISSSEWYRNEEPNFCPFCGLKLVDSQEDKEKEDDKDCLNCKYRKTTFDGRISSICTSNMVCKGW